MIKGSLEVKLPTIWRNEKQRRVRGKRGDERSRREKKQRKRKNQKKEDTAARNVRQVAKHCVFPMICGLGGSKTRLAKAAGAEPCGSEEK